MEQLQLIYQDSSIVVCIKPAGVLSQGKPGEQNSMLTLLESQLGGSFYPVHRLDRETRGLMVFARTSEAAAALDRQIQAGSLHKQYLAVVSGIPETDRGDMEDLLLFDRQKNKAYTVKRKRGGVRHASLSYCVLDRTDGASLVQVELHTGRTHQIRVQFASRGMPLLGDRRYGGPAGELCLVSAELRFAHPQTQEPLSFRHVPDLLGPFTDICFQE